MSLFLRWPLTIVLFIFLLLGIFYLTTRNKRVVSKIRTILFLFSAIGGVLIYSYSNLVSVKALADIPVAVLKVLLTTIRMFLTNSDNELFSNALSARNLSDNIWLQIAFWLVHASALIVMQIFLVSMFGRKLLGYFKLRHGSHSEVYMIKGGDAYALMLGENIATHDNPKRNADPNRLVVFLLGKGDDPKVVAEKISHFDGIAEVLDRNHDLLYHLKTAGLGTKRGHGKKYNLVLMTDNQTAPDDAVLAAEYAKGNGTAPENLNVFVFVSSEWEREKIEDITQAKEDGGRKYPYTFHIIKEKDLLVRQMLKKHPPFECPGLGFKDGMASRNFTVMVIGFGTIGQNVLLRLIMNGQFAGSRMRAIVVDKNIEDIRSAFLHRYPGLELCCDIEPLEYDVQGEQFYKLLAEESYVDYVVVALNDDEKNKQTARDIRLNYERKDIDALPVIAVFEDGGGYKAANEGKIFTFGRREAIYKESIIIRAEADRRAQAVNDVYMKIYGGQPWHELDWALHESNRASADFIPAMLYLARSGEDKTMNEEVAIKKGFIAEKGSTLEETLAQTEHLRWNAFHAAMGYRPITIEEMKQRFESYKGNGNPLDYARRDSKSRLQVCLALWDDLDKVNEAYRELARLANNAKEQKRDFKENDRDVIRNIPKFLSAAKG